MDEIKPCPFCGSKRIRVDHCTKRVRCQECFATSGIISKFIKDGTSENEAPLLAWNTRFYEKD